MATKVPNCLATAIAEPEALSAVDTCRRRRISPRAARARMILGHSIEYLCDEFVNEKSSFLPNRDLIDALHLLMDLDRQVFSECPEVPTLGERFRAVFRFL
jgi:hypothetical protein